MADTINFLGIDVATRDKDLIIARLNRLKSTTQCEDGGMYHFDQSLSQIHIQTTMNECELDDWLYRIKFSRSVDIMGTFERNESND